MTVILDPTRALRRAAAPVGTSLLFAPLFLFTLLGTPTDASAKEAELPVDPAMETEPPSVAEELFEAGRDAMKRGEFELACKKFTESYRAEPAVGTLLNLGNCEERQGKLATALTLYTQAAVQLDPSDPRAGFARKRAAELGRKAPTLTVRVDTDAPQKIRVTRNGQPLTTELGTPVRLDPGPVVVVAEATGHHPRVYQLDLSPGSREQLSVAVGARIAPLAEAPPRARSTNATLGYGLLAAGGASAITAGTFGFLTMSEYEIVREHCDIERRSCSDATGQTAAKTGATYETLAYVFGGAALVTLSLGSYLLLTDDAAPTPQGQLSLSVAASEPGSPGLVLNGTF